MFPTAPRITFSVRNNGHTETLSWGGGGHDDATFHARVNGVRVFTAPGQPFTFSLQEGKQPFLVLPRPAFQLEPVPVHLDVQTLVEQAAKIDKKREREEAAPEEAAEEPKKKKPRRPLTEEQKAAKAAKAAATKAAKAAAAAAAAAAVAPAPKAPEKPAANEDEEEDEEEESTK